MDLKTNGSALLVGASLRRFPYPYRAALAVCNDADSMTTESLRFIHKYLNTDKPTPLGRGLRLPIGDSFFLFSSPASPNKLTFFERISSSLSPDAEFLAECARGGLLDTLHTYGCFTSPDDFSRDLAKVGLEALQKMGIEVCVWVNHGAASNVQCFGLRGLEHHRGDQPGGKFYHTDITLAYGIRYCWAGDEMNDCIGQDSRLSLEPYLDRACTALRYVGRRRLSSAKQQVRPLLRPINLRDGNQVLSFQRYSGTLGLTPVIEDLPKQLSQNNLEKLKKREGYSVIYQHFAVRRKQKGFGVDSYRPNSEPYFLPEEKAAFERLAEQYHNGDIFVTTTSRLLRYNTVHRGLKWTRQRAGEGLRIVLTGIEEPGGPVRPITRREIEGLTFYSSRPRETELFIKNGNGEERVTELVFNPPDATGRPSVSVQQSPVGYPEL